MQKLILETEWTPTIEVYGISCHVRDYRLCWALNQELGLSFTKEDEALFKCKDESKQISYSLLRNRKESGYLLPELKHADFLFVALFGEDSEPKEHFGNIQKTQFVNAVFSLGADYKTKALELIELDVF